jgi:hypothetical protein
VDIDEWGQVTVLNMLTRYARSQFIDPNKVTKFEFNSLKINFDLLNRLVKMKKKVFMMMKMKRIAMVMMMMNHQINERLLWIVIIDYYYDVLNLYYKVEIHLYAFDWNHNRMYLLIS